MRILRSRGHGSDDECIASPCGQDVLNIFRVDRDVEVQLLNHVGDGSGPLADGIAERDVQIGADDGEDNSGDAAARADIENLFTLAEMVCNGEGCRQCRGRQSDRSRYDG